MFYTVLIELEAECSSKLYYSDLWNIARLKKPVVQAVMSSAPIIGNFIPEDFKS